MENWPLDLASTQSCWWLWQGWFLWSGQSPKTADLSKARTRGAGDSKCTQLSELFSKKGTKKRGDHLRQGGASSKFFRVGEISHVGLWGEQLRGEGRPVIQDRADDWAGKFPEETKLLGRRDLEVGGLFLRKEGMLDIWNFLSMHAWVSRAQLLKLNVYFLMWLESLSPQYVPKSI